MYSLTMLISTTVSRGPMADKDMMVISSQGRIQGEGQRGGYPPSIGDPHLQ